LTKGVIKWLTSIRRLDADVLQQMDVQAQIHPQLGEVVAFPYIRDGKRYAAKFRTESHRNWRSTQGVSRGLYNEDVLTSEGGPIVITEGEIDALSVMQAGYKRVVSLPDGWTPDGGKRDVLVTAEIQLRSSPFVIVAGDNDAAGESLPRTVANILIGHDVRYARWPDGCKDANDVLCKHGEEVLARCLDEAKQIDPAGGFITGISDLPPMPARRVLRMGCNPFDLVIGFEVGAMSVGTGIPGSGKSTFTTFAAYHIAMNEKVRVGFMSFETHAHRTRDHLCRLHMGIPWDELNDEQRQETGVYLDRYFRVVHRTYDTSTHNLGWLRDMIYTLAVRDNCKLIVVDPWNELEHLPERGESMTAYINFGLQQIRVWAEQFDTHICVIAHPRKMPTDGMPRAPVGYDISDSAAFSNKPALGFTVHQDELTNGQPIVKIIVWKVRDTQLYAFEKGQISLEFNSTSMTYFKNVV
jgi:twinkle protein